MIYLDNAATTKITRPVYATMLPYIIDNYGNASSVYKFGRDNKNAIEEARCKVAQAINAEPEQIIFTSGATESNNWVCSNHDKIICSSFEHHSVSHNPNVYSKFDSEKYMQLSLDKLARAGYRDILVSHMMVNNETGEIYNIKNMINVCRKEGALFHTDATQAFGHIPINVKALDVDYLSLSGHKFHAPKGIGVLYVKNPSNLKPMLYGGKQEKNKRAGTEVVPSIVGIGKAAEMYNYNIETDNYIKILRELLKTSILSNISDVIINEPANHINNILSISCKNIESESLVLMMDSMGVCISGGSACNSGSLEPSETVKSLNLPEDYMYGTVRFSLSELNTSSDVDMAASALRIALKNLRG